MANLGGKITLDISDLQAKIILANKAIKSNEASWRESASQMEDWTKSEDALKTKLDVLNEKIKTQRDIVSMLSDKKKLLIEKYGEESKQVERVNADIIKYSKAIENSQKENEKIKTTLANLQKEQKGEEKSVESATKAVKENTKASNNNADTQKALSNSVKSVSNGFTVLKGVVANLTTTLITKTFGAVKNIASSLMALPESTRELRKELIQIETAFSSVGFSTKSARDAWLNYSSVMGSVDSSANETLSLLAGIVETTEDLTTWTNVLTGVYAKLGNAYPTKELVKNITETSKSGKMTENLTKVLQSAGVNCEKFTAQITKLNDEQERADFILTTLNNAYGQIGITLQSTNKQITEAEKAEKRLNLAWTQLGNAMEPVKTQITTAISSVIESFSGLMTGTGDIETFNYNIGYMAGTIAKSFQAIYSMLEPALTALKTNLIKWFTDNEDTIKTTVTNFLKGIFGSDTVDTVTSWISTITKPIADFFKKIHDGDYVGAFKVALPAITIGVGLSLIQGTISALPSLILSGLTSGFNAKGVTIASSAIAGLIGAISLGMAIKECMTGENTYENLGANVVAGILAGLAVAGLTGSISGGVIVASLVLQTGVGETAYNYAKDAVNDPDTSRATVGLSVIEVIKEDINNAEINKLVEEKLKEGGEKGAEEIGDYLITKIGGTPYNMKFEFEGEIADKQRIAKEFRNALNFIPSTLDASQRLVALYGRLSNEGKKVAEEFVAGFGYGIEELPEISKLQASAILIAIKDTLGIHSPSKEAEKIGINFTQGWIDGLAGMPNRTVEIVEETLDSIETTTEKSVGFWKKTWLSIGEWFGNAWTNIKTPFIEMGKYLKESFTSWEGFFSMLGDGFNLLKEGVTSARDLVVTILEGYNKEEGAQGVYNNLYDSAVDAIKSSGGWGTLIGLVLEQVKNAMDSDQNATTYLGEVVDDIINGIMKLLEDLPTIAKLALQFILELGKGLIKALPEIIKMLPDIVSAIISEFMNMLPDFLQLGVELIKGIGQGIWEGVKGIWKLIKKAGEAILNGFKSLFGIHSPSRVMRDQIGKNIVAGITEGIEDNVPSINSALDHVNTKLNLKVTGPTNGSGNGTKVVNVYQNNNYSKSYSAYELYKSERAIKNLVGAY